MRRRRPGSIKRDTVEYFACNFFGGTDSHLWRREGRESESQEEIMKRKVLSLMAMCMLAGSLSVYAQDRDPQFM